MEMTEPKPLVFDLFCGLFGWGAAFAETGYRVIGFDLEDQYQNFRKQKPDNCELVLCDVRSLTGAGLVSRYGVPACIVASPPCQFFAYVAMPWSKAKALGRKVESDQALRAHETQLFNECFRIQREVSAAAGHYVPMVIENVRGAQKWVGRARWNFGSYYLWGDVPALMPIPTKKVLKEGIAHRSSGETNFHGYKSSGMNWSDQTKRGQDFTRIAGRQAEGVRRMGRRYGSKSLKRKEASAVIAKIPPALAQWIAKVYYPKKSLLDTFSPSR